MHSRVVFRYVTFSTRNYRVLTVLVRGGGELLQGGMLNTSHKVASFMRGIQIYMAFFMMLAGLMQASAQSLITPQAPAPLVVDPAATGVFLKIKMMPARPFPSPNLISQAPLLPCRLAAISFMLFMVLPAAARNWWSAPLI
jgi:hypothetical protein